LSFRHLRDFLRLDNPFFTKKPPSNHHFGMESDYSRVRNWLYMKGLGKPEVDSTITAWKGHRITFAGEEVSLSYQIRRIT